VLNDVRSLPIEKLIDLYGIEVSEDGTVFDPTENRRFDNLQDWAECVAEQEDDSNYSTFSKIGGRYAFDDED
jgi:hypothetical protein